MLKCDIDILKVHSFIVFLNEMYLFQKGDFNTIIKMVSSLL